MKCTKFFNIALLLGTFTLTGCNFLDLDESDDLTKDQILESYNRTKQLATNVYTYLPDDFCKIEGAMQDAATDDAVHVYNWSNIQRFVNGTWSPNYTVDDKWATLYSGIRDANFYLKETAGQTFDDWKTSDSYDQWMKNFNNFQYEVRFLRAFYYFELVKRYRNVPLVKDVLTQEEVNKVSPTPYTQVMDFVISECTDVAKELPVNYTGFSDKETGRITKGAALALKARAMLYMASPLYANANDKEKWIAAAKASYEIIGKASEYGYRLTTYATLYADNNNTNAEVILCRPTGLSSSFESANYPMGAEGGRTSTCPTENLVSSYEMKDGTTFDWTNPAMKSDPYANRDPRLAFTIAYNGMVWPYNKALEIWEGGANALPITNATTTGYYLKKYMNNTVDFRSGVTTQNKHHNWILFRYAEVLLNYAEAMVNAFDDPNYTNTELPLSALKAVNQVRERSDVAMPPLPEALTAESFKAKLKNERRVELAFEGHRFWDLRRWKSLDESKNIYAVKVVKEGGVPVYTKQLLTTHIVSNKMYWYPISNTELYKNRNLEQNPDW